jgi:hypothetical protein
MANAAVLKTAALKGAYRFESCALREVTPLASRFFARDGNILGNIRPPSWTVTLNESNSEARHASASERERSSAYRNYERNLASVELMIELLRLKFQAFKQGLIATKLDTSRMARADS